MKSGFYNSKEVNVIKLQNYSYFKILSAFHQYKKIINDANMTDRGFSLFSLIPQTLFNKSTGKYFFIALQCIAFHVCNIITCIEIDGEYKILFAQD
jgi:hypothetical protein